MKQSSEISRRNNASPGVSLPSALREIGTKGEASSLQPFDVERVRRDFPILSTKVHGKPLIYLDNGATTQKPRAVIDRITHYYERENANIHRGVYELSQNATRLYDEVREKVARFINAREPAECIFLRGTTEGINLVAQSFGRSQLRAGDEIILGAQEHHSDIVPWQMIAQQTGAAIRVIPMNDAGELLLDEYAKLLSAKTRIVCVAQLSNSLGTINDVKKIAQMAHRAGAKLLIDGAHFPTDVQDIDADFYTFSGHKMFGPTGIGVLYGRRELLDAMPPFLGGGDMIESVTFEKTSYAPLPNKFEAGTPDIAGVIGLGAAIDYINSLGFDSFMPYEQELFDYATRRLQEVPGLRMVGTAKSRASVISFVLENPPLASLDIGMKLDREGICVRTGHHCCQPVMDRFGIGSTARLSLSLYNTKSEIDAAVDALKRLRPAVIPTSAGVSAERTSQPLIFPPASGASPQAVADEMAQVFDFLEEKNARNEQVLDYGKQLPDYFDALSKLTRRVPGCMSQVYMIARPVPGAPERFEFVADADAHIVRGEIAMLQKLYSGQRAKDVLAFDIDSFFKRIGLEHFLTQQRRNGLASMVHRIRESARNIMEQKNG